MILDDLKKQRYAVIGEALSWNKTPYHHAAALKGVGVDCVHFPAAVYNAAMGLSIKVHFYSPQWHLHQTGKDGKHEELYLIGLKDQGFIELSDGVNEPFDPDNFIDAKKDIGDLVVTKLARTFAHSAIITGWPYIIHAESSPMGRGAVTTGRADVNWFFTSRPLRFYSRKEWHGPLV